MKTSLLFQRNLLAGFIGFIAVALFLGSVNLTNAGDCKHRGDLDVRYCDENRDFLADTPDDSSQWRGAV